MAKQVFRTPFDPPGRDSDLGDFGPSLTQQQFKDDADLNVMLERFKVTGNMPVPAALPQYGDFSGVSDFRTALDTVRKAEGQFMALDAKLRARFGHDPQALLEFISDDKNREEAVKLGLVNPAAPVPEPISVRVVPSPAS